MMIVDCMTERMRADGMYYVILCKSRKQKGRAKAKSTGNDPQHITGDDPQDITEHGCGNSTANADAAKAKGATGTSKGKAKGKGKTTRIKGDASWIRGSNSY